MALGVTTMALLITSGVFLQNGEIPSHYTCEGKDSSPPIHWTGIPAKAKSLALIVDDPDAPGMTYVHWVLYNIPVTTDGLEEAIKELPAGTLQGPNGWGKLGYGGPCPPTGRHRYFFKLYALDAALPDLNKPSAAQLEKAMQGHILEKAELMGTYAKRKL